MLYIVHFYRNPQKLEKGSILSNHIVVYITLKVNLESERPLVVEPVAEHLAT